MQEAKRFRATNADVLTTFLADIDNVIRNNNIDERRIANTDESGVTPDRDISGVGRKKVYGTRADSTQHQKVEFRNVHRVTILPVILASGNVRRPLFVFRGRSMPYRVVANSGTAGLNETLVDCLPRESIVTSREDLAGVDKPIFIR